MNTIRIFKIIRKGKLVPGHIVIHIVEKSQLNMINVRMPYASTKKGSLKMETNCGQNTNRCNQCMYALYQTGNLRTHMKTHSGEKLNQCNQFNYISSDPSTLRTHLKRHSEVILHICHGHHGRCPWRKNLSCGEISPHDILLLEEIFHMTD